MNGSFAVGWRQVFASMVIMACSAMVASTYGIVAVPLAKEFHPSRMVLMLAMTVMAAGSGIMSPFLGNLMDKISLRKIVGVGIALLVGGYVALSFVTSFIQVIVICGLFFAGSNILAGPISATVLLTRWFDKRRGTALGIAISGIAAGTVIFPLVIQALFNAFDWREGLRSLALILFLCCAPALMLLVNRPEDRGLHADGADYPPQALQPSAQAQTLSTGAILSDPAFWLVAFVVTVVLSGMMGMVTNVVPMARDLGVDANAAAAIVSVYAATGVVAKLSFAAVADRLNPRYLMFLVPGLFGAGMVALAHATAGYTMILIGAGLIGTGGMMIPLQSFVVPRIFGHEVVGRVSGLLSFVNLCALLATPPIFGLVFDRTHSYAPAFFAFAGLALTAMVLVPKIRLSPRGAVPEDIAPTALRGDTVSGPSPAP
jgi:MFS family permease